MAIKKLFLITGLIFLALTTFKICFSQEINTSSFTGRVSASSINVRSDATTSSAVICNLSKQDTVLVIAEKYGWYKIKLPAAGNAFIKKTLVLPLDEKTARAVKENINIRVGPGESFAIIGKIDKNEIVNVIEDKGDWLRIVPTSNSFGWINKKFVDKLDVLPTQEKPKESKQETKNNGYIIEGIIKPYGKVFKRSATHKLIAKGGNTFLIKGNQENLNSLINHKVKIIGKLLSEPKEKYPLIEITKMEALD